ncbi:MAG: hypothetical protein ABSE73_28965 [Planctomycetota bacterium]
MTTSLHVALCGTVLAASLFLPAAEGDGELKIEATGLRLVAPAVSADESVRAFNWSLADWSPGTAVALLITAPKGGLVQFDSANSMLIKFSDDKGTDLLARPPTSAPNQQRGTMRSTGNTGISLFPKVSQDGRFCAVEVNTPNLPAKGASRLRLEGVITMLCATEKTEHAQKNVPLRDSATINAPNLELIIRETGKPEMGAEPLGLTLRACRDLDEVAEIRFYKPDGSEIKSRRTGTSKMGLLGTLTVDWNYNLAELVDSATVKVFLWKDMRKTKTPFGLDIDVGSF